MRPSLRAAFLATLCMILSAGSASSAGFRGFERQGFPEECPQGRVPEGTPGRSIIAQRAVDPIRVDGRLEDAVWRDAQTGSGFLRWSPDRGTTPTEETVFKVAYDDQAIYFGVACHENDPANIASALSRRDQLRDSDQVSIYIDPYHDRTTGYNFRVTPDGVQEDSYLFNDGDRDRDWDAVWEAETFRDEKGWYAEVRIPFSSIRYRAQDSMTWGLQVFRFMQRRGEDTAWVMWDQETSGFVSRFGEIRGLAGVRSPRQLEVLPYVVQRTTDPSVEGPEDKFDNFQNFGADLKYGVTPDLTLNATFQPDFGQVEADPAVLNLSPFETFFSEKRPFFIEGSRFYQMNSFNMFYSRRIGTGDENARIRAASKLTGKVAGNISVAAMYAATDITTPGRAHNFLQSGKHLSHFAVGRFGKDFAEGRHRVHVMQTAVLRPNDRPTLDDSERAFRDGYTSGMDFEMNFADRAYRVSGAVVGSVVDPGRVLEDPSVDHSARYGTGGQLSLNKRSGTIRTNISGRWESPKLDLNDIGFLGAPNEMNTSAWVGWRYNAPTENPRLNQANFNVNAWRGWVMGAARELSEDTGQTLWQYGAGLPSNGGGNINGYVQFRNYVGTWAGLRVSAARNDIFITRGGPPMDRPAEWGGWWGIESDWRKPYRLELDTGWAIDAEDGYFWEAELEADWDASSRFRIGTDFGYWARREKADYLDTIDRGDPALGIGGQSYVFGDLTQKTASVTLRSNVLFDRSRSLELYFQPFVTVGDYTNARELLRPNSYDLAPYDVDGFQAGNSDFSFGSVNVNLVYRWEYRPGSTFFLVWTHSRSDFESREDSGDPGFSNPLSAAELFRNEPENTILAKFTYWLSL